MCTTSNRASCLSYITLRCNSKKDLWNQASGSSFTSSPSISKNESKPIRKDCSVLQRLQFVLRSAAKESGMFKFKSEK